MLITAKLSHKVMISPFLDLSGTERILSHNLGSLLKIHKGMEGAVWHDGKGMPTLELAQG